MTEEMTHQPLELESPMIFGNASSGSPLRILMLEDRAMDAELISEELDNLELTHEVKVATNKEGYLKALVDFAPHIVLSDYSLPQYTGMEALQDLKRISGFVPFIICTGSLNEETAVACIKAGADDYVLKDSMGRLVSAMLNALENKRVLVEREKTSADLLKSEEIFRAIAENAPDLIFKVGRDGTILFCNRTVDERPLDEIIGDTIFNTVAPLHSAALSEALDHCWVNKKSTSIELSGDPESANSRWFLCRIGPVLKNGKVEALVVIPSDITSRKLIELEREELNEKLHSLSRHLENIRDEEKKKIAMEIHDQLGQELTGNKLGLFWIQQHLKTKGMANADEQQVHDKINYLIELSTQTIQTVRRIAHELRPVVLDDLGLIPAIEWHVENYNKNHEVICHLDIVADRKEFEKELATAIYRITQEALTNVNRHAQAKNIWVTLHCKGNSIQLTISDDGIGIDLEKASKSKSLGLFGIKERIKSWNGIIDITGLPGEGTTIDINLTTT